MASYNRIVLMGNLTRDPQLTYTSANTAICKFGLATNEKWKDREGALREEVCFVDCTIFGKPAETFSQYMAKGRAVLLEGRLRFDQWTSPEGDKRSKHEVVVDRYTFVGSGGGQRGEAGERGGDMEPAAAPRGRTGGYSRGGSDDAMPPPAHDDIPF